MAKIISRFCPILFLKVKIVAKHSIATATVFINKGLKYSIFPATPFVFLYKPVASSQYSEPFDWLFTIGINNNSNMVRLANNSQMDCTLCIISFNNFNKYIKRAILSNQYLDSKV